MRNERQANNAMSDRAAELSRFAQWAARNPSRPAHPRPSLIVRILRALGF